MNNFKTKEKNFVNGFEFNNQLKSILFHNVVVLSFRLMPFSFYLNINKFIHLQQNKAWFIAF